MTASRDIPFTIEDVITDEVSLHIEESIRVAEMNTSGEIRVHLENDCPEEPLDRAAFIFAHLNMHKTELRNGVLIYVALRDRKVAIIGDVGINTKLPADSWDHIRSSMTELFKQGLIEQGVKEAIGQVGEKIREHFPIASSDRNELTNQISKGHIGRKS